MGFIDKIKDFIYNNDSEYEEEMGYEEEATGTDHAAPRTPSVQGTVRSAATSDYTPRTGRVVNIQTSAQLQVMLVQPDSFDDCKPIADELNRKITVVLNLEGRAPDLSRRVLDFLSGVTYANAGSIKKVAKNTYMLTPSNVDLRGDLMDELQSSGFMP